MDKLACQIVHGMCCRDYLAIFVLRIEYSYDVISDIEHERGAGQAALELVGTNLAYGTLQLAVLDHCLLRLPRNLHLVLLCIWCFSLELCTIGCGPPMPPLHGMNFF